MTSTTGMGRWTDNETQGVVFEFRTCGTIVVFGLHLNVDNKSCVSTAAGIVHFGCTGHTMLFSRVKVLHNRV